VVKRAIVGLVAITGALAGLAACSSILGFHDVTLDANALDGSSSDGAPAGGDTGATVDGSSMMVDATTSDGATDATTDGATATDGAMDGATDGAINSADSAADAATDGASQDAADGGSCGDTTSSAQNCGRCGHSCLGGTCAAGTCQPVALIKGLFDPITVAVDGVNVYVTVGDGKEVLKANKADGLGLTVVNNNEFYTLQARGLAIDTTNIYWTQDLTGTPPTGGIFSCPLTGCIDGGATTLAVGDGPRSIGVVGDSVFWVENVGQVVRRVGVDGGNPGTLVDVDAGLSPFRMAVDDMYVYFTDDANGLGLARVPQAGGAVVSLGSGGTSTYGVAVSSAGVFFTYGGTIDGVVALAPKNASLGTPPTIFATAQNSPIGLAADATNVYWTNRASATGADGAILTCPLAGCSGGPTVLATNQAQPINIVTDADAIYWVNNGKDNTATDGAVFKLAKP
jgi:hypothetical protein